MSPSEKMSNEMKGWGIKKEVLKNKKNNNEGGGRRKRKKEEGRK